MNILNTLAASWKEIGEQAAWAKGWLGDLLEVMSTVLWVALALVGSAGAIYAVYVGIKMARADSAEAREENKKRLINIIVSIVVVIVLIVTFNVFVPMIVEAVYKAQSPDDILGEKPVQTLTNTIKCLIRV